jgi:hypothetical protein
MKKFLIKKCSLLITIYLSLRLHKKNVQATEEAFSP